MGRLVVVAGVAVVLSLCGCGYDTNNQNSPNSTQVGTNTARPTP